MDRPKITLNDPRSINSPRKTILASRVETAMETEELSAKKFKEILHPRDAAGIFTKSSKKSKTTYGKIFQPLLKKDKTDIRNSVEVEGDQGFKDILVGLALGAINEVHPISTNLSLKIKQDKLESGTNGVYAIDDKTIKVDSKSEHGSLSAIHEIGHYLDDNMKTPLGNLGLRFDRGVFDAINNSGIVKLMKSVYDKPDLSKDEKSAVDYLTNRRELFARAYTQYVVSRSSNPTLKSEFKKMQAEEQTNWEDVDFEPIGREFDRIFKTKPKTVAKKKKGR